MLCRGFQRAAVREELTRDRFLETSFTATFQGRGLAVAAVCGIVEKHGGIVYGDFAMGRAARKKIF